MALAKMRQLEERQVEKDVDAMLWSPTMDILAVRWNLEQEVSLYRLNWQRIWTVRPPVEQCQCTQMVWRPDGKNLALGYTTGHLVIMDVESNKPLHSHTLTGQIQCLSWTASATTTAPGPGHSNVRSLFDDDWDFLIKFPSLSKAFSGGVDKESCVKLKDGGHMTLLIAGTSTGMVHIFVNGFLGCYKLDTTPIFGRPCGVISASISPSQFDMLSVACEAQTDCVADLRLITLASPVLASCLPQLHLLSTYFAITKGILDYIEGTFKQLEEAWESVLVELDAKLANFAMKLPECGVAADFLDLLMFGVSSPELEHFLHSELTKKALKKFDHSIEMSHSNIQRLVLLFLNTVSQSLNFHLTELLGHCQANPKFDILGLKQEAIVQSQKLASQFWAKGIELQQVLEESLKCFKAFLRWLFIEIGQPSSESEIGDDLTKVSQQDLQFIAQFLDSFSSVTPQNSRQKYLEKIGQYLKDDDLSRPVDRSSNIWCAFLQDNPDLQDLPYMISMDSSSSPLKDFKCLRQSVNVIFDGFNAAASDQYQQQLGQLHIQFSSSSLPTAKHCCRRIRQFECCSSGKVYGLIAEVEESHSSKMGLLYYEIGELQNGWQTARLVWLSFEPMKLVDFDFYNSQTISLLLESSSELARSQRIIQLPVAAMESHLTCMKLSPYDVLRVDHECVPSRSVFDLADQACHRDLENIVARTFAVSGTRNVAALLFENKKRIRIYDMEIEEGDFEDENETSGYSNG